MQRLSRVSLCLAGGLALGACSAIVEFAECKADIDCAGAGDGYVCGPAGACVPGEAPATGSDATTEPPVPTTGEGTTTTGEPGDTTTTAETTGTTEPSTDTTTGGPLTCAAHTECTTALGPDHVCGKEGACISALTPECQTLQWPGGEPNDKVVWLGSVMSASPPFDALVLPLQNAVQLAVEDFNANTELQGGYKVAWLACDDHGDAQRAVAAAQHLSGTIGAPAIVGPIFSELVLLLAEEVTVASETLLFSPTASAKSITGLADEGLVWRTISSDIYQASALADRLTQLEPAPERVAVLAKEDAYGKGLLMDTVARITSEQPALEVSAHPYPNPVGLTPEQIMNMYPTIVASAWGKAGEHPDTIILIGTNEVLDLILGFMLAWSAENPAPQPPRVIVSHGVVPTLPQLIDKAMSQPLKTLLMSITEGVAPVIFDTENFANFNIRYKIRFNDQEPITASSLSYDAALVTMLAMAAVPEGEPVTGPAIAANIAKLVDKQGTKVSFGDVEGAVLTFLKKARNALVTGGTVDLRGVSGELDFDLEAGEVRTDLIGWGIDPKQNMPDVGVLAPKRTYILEPPPSVEGAWMDL